MNSWRRLPGWGGLGETHRERWDFTPIRSGKIDQSSPAPPLHQARSTPLAMFFVEIGGVNAVPAKLKADKIRMTQGTPPLNQPAQRLSILQSQK